MGFDEEGVGSCGEEIEGGELEHPNSSIAQTSAITRVFSIFSPRYNQAALEPHVPPLQPPEQHWKPFAQEAPSGSAVHAGSVAVHAPSVQYGVLAQQSAAEEQETPAPLQATHPCVPVLQIWPEGQ